MCELLGLSGSAPFSVTFSLDEFARHGGKTGPHRDGWGIAFYEGRDVRLIKEAKPAADSETVAFVKGQNFNSPLVLSHIRRATVGNLSLANTQPFTRELGGRIHVFAHNGHLAGIEQTCALSRQRFAPVGDTDSEYAFCVLMERLADLWLGRDTPPSLAERYEVVRRFAAEIGPLGPANFLYADGEALFAHGNKRTQEKTGKIEPPGLHWLTRTCRPDGEPQIDGLDLKDGNQSVVLIASVPLTDEAWQPVREGEVICVRDGARVEP